MAKWLDKYEQGGLVLKKKTKDNYGKKPNPNNVQASVGPDFVGLGYNIKGRNYSPAWGGQFQDGGILGKRFLQPNDPKLPKGWNPEAKGYSTEYSTTVGKDGQYYLVPGFKRGKLLSDPKKEFHNTGEMLGGPFKTIQSAQDFADRRHKYVEQGIPIPSPMKTYDEFAMGGSIPGAVGFTYARVAGAAPSNGKYAKKTKASAQDGKQVVDNSVLLNFDTSDPAFDYVKESNFVNFDPKNFEGIKQNMARYMNSPLYMERLGKSIPDQEVAKDVQKRRLDNLLSVKLNPKTVDQGTYYNLLQNRVNLGANDFVDNPTIAHEVAHGIIPITNASYGKKNLLSKAAIAIGGLFQPFEKFTESELEKINRPLSGRVTAPNERYQKAIQEEHYAPQGSKASARTAAGETYGDLTGMRQLLLDNGITTEFGQELTPEMFQKALKNPKISNEPVFQRMKLKFKDEDIIKMNNEVAQLNNAAPLTQAQNGKEMKFYQQGLDFTPKTISKNGSVIKDDMGQWAHPGEITEINSNDITMEGVDYPVLGISDTGDTKLMQPGENYKFKGKKVTEFPMMKNGGWLDKYKAQDGENIPEGMTLPTVTVTSSKPSKWGNMKFVPVDPSNIETISQWNPRPGEIEAMTVAEQARKDEEDSWYNNRRIKSLRNSAFADWRPYAIAGGITAAPAISSALGLGSTAAALATPIAGVPGLTGANVLNTIFAYQGLKNLPNVASSIETAYTDPTLSNIGNAALETGVTALDVLPFAATVTPEIKAAINASKESGLLSKASELNPWAWSPEKTSAIAEGAAENTSTTMLDKVLGKSKYRDRVFAATKNLYEQIAGRYMRNEENKAAIAEGNEWLKNWIQSEATKDKLANRARSISYSFSQNPNIVRKIDMLQNYTPNVSEYPIRGSLDDFLRILMGSKEKMVHQGNIGVAHRHSLNPFFDEPKFKIGDPSSGPGTWINRAVNISSPQRTSTTIHEGVHDWFRHEPLETFGYSDLIKSSVSENALDQYHVWLNSKIKDHGLGYYANPPEVHARIMQMRHQFGLTPETYVTPKMAEDMLKIVEQGNTPVKWQFPSIFDNYEEVADLFNKLPAALPAVAIGAGALGGDSKEKKKNGGWLDKHTPKAQTGITTSIGSGTTNPTVQLTTQEDVKKVKKKADDDTKAAFAAAAKRDKKNQAYISKDKSTPASRAADEQMLIDAYVDEAQRNSPLVQTFGSLTPGGYNPEAGATAARFIGEANPIMSGVRMSRAIRDSKNNPYGIGEGKGYLSNILGTLGLVGDVLDIGVFGNLALKGASNIASDIASDIDRVATKTGTAALNSAGAKAAVDDVKRALYSEIGNPGTSTIYNKGSKRLQIFDESGKEVGTQVPLSEKAVKFKNSLRNQPVPQGATPPPPEGLMPYITPENPNPLVYSRSYPTGQSEIDWAKWNPEILKDKELLKEYHDIEEMAKATNTWMKNADGTPFTLPDGKLGTPEQFVQMQSKNFKKAFPEGVDITYRGDAEHYPALRPENSPFFGKSIFTANEDLARFYTPKGPRAEYFTPFEPTAQQNLENYIAKHFKPGYTVEQFLKDYPQLSRGVAATETAGLHQLAIPKTKNVLNFNAAGQDFSLLSDPAVYKKLTEEGIIPHNRPTKGVFDTDNIAEYIEKAGLDRAVIQNVDDGSIGNVLIHNQKPGKFAKSLRGNSGKFDMSNPDVYKALIPAIGVGALKKIIDSKEEKKNGGWLNKYK